MRCIVKLGFLAVLLFTMPVQAGVVLLYHHISEQTPEITSTTPEIFAEHLAFLQRERIEVLPLGDLVSRNLSGDGSERPQVAITFDDGFSDIYQNALPLLSEYQYPFTVFVNTGSVGQPGYMSWSQLKKLRAAGATIANHSVNHGHLIRRQEGESQAQWGQRIKAELRQAQSAITSQLGEAPDWFAYPFGEFDRPLTELTQELQFLGFGQHSGAVGRFTHPQRIPRFPMGGQYGELEDFAIKVHSLALPVTAETMESGGGDQRDPYLTLAGETPVLLITLEDKALAERLSCYYRGQPLQPEIVSAGEVRIRLPSPVSAGRSRVNCTAHLPDGNRYYWHSYPLFIKGASGQWIHQD